MDATDKVFAGSIPELYDRLLVPMIFAPYAEDLARRVAALAPRDVLAMVFPDDPPHGYADVEIEPIEMISRGASAHEVATAPCQGTPLRSEIEAA